MKPKPHILINRHRKIPYKWRCVWGRYNGYSDVISDAYNACLKCVSRSKYWESDMKKYPQLRSMFLS